MKKLFIIQKYVVASSIQEALKQDKHVKPDEWKQAYKPITDEKPVGFNKSPLRKK